MSKTICWPSDFAQEVLDESPCSIRFAIRPGSLYYDTKYFKKGEQVDIRIDSLIVRKAIIQDELKLLQIKDLMQVHYNLLKKGINSQEKLIKFLSKRYNQQITEESQITLIAYMNMNLIHLKEN